MVRTRVPVLRPPMRWVEVTFSSRKSVAQISVPPMRMRPKRRGIGAPSVAAVTRSASRRAPSTRWAGWRRLSSMASTLLPSAVPMAPPMVAAEIPRIEPPTMPPTAAPAAPRTNVAISAPPAREEEGRDRPAAPAAVAAGLDHAGALHGVDHAAALGQHAAVFGKAPGRHAEHQQRPGGGEVGGKLDHPRAQRVEEDLAPAALAPERGVGGDRGGLGAVQRAPDAAGEAEAVAARAAGAGLVEIGRAEPAPRLGDHEGGRGRIER